MFGKTEFNDIYEDKNFLADCRNRTKDPFKFQIESTIALYRCLKTILNSEYSDLEREQLDLIETHASTIELILEHVHINSENYRSIDFFAMLELLKEKAQKIKKRELQLQVFPSAKSSLNNLINGYEIMIDRHYALWTIMSDIKYYTNKGPLKEGIPLILYNYYYLIGHSISFLENFWSDSAFKDKLTKSLEFGQESRTSSYELFIPGLLSCFGIMLKPRKTSNEQSPDFDIISPRLSGVIECRMKSESTNDLIKWIIDSIQVKNEQVANSSSPHVLCLECGNISMELLKKKEDLIHEILYKSKVHHVMITSTNTLILNNSEAKFPLSIYPILTKDFFSEAIIKNRDNF